MFCTVTDLMIFWPNETSPKSSDVFPLSEMATIGGLTVGQWIFIYRVLWILQERKIISTSNKQQKITLSFHNFFQWHVNLSQVWLYFGPTVTHSHVFASQVFTSFSDLSIIQAIYYLYIKSEIDFISMILLLNLMLGLGIKLHYTPSTLYWKP